MLSGFLLLRMAPSNPFSSKFSRHDIIHLVSPEDETVAEINNAVKQELIVKISLSGHASLQMSKPYGVQSSWTMWNP